MTAPANLTYAGIETRVANALRIPTTNTTEMTKLAAIINECYRDVYMKHDWWWLLKRTVINTTLKISTSMSVTIGSTSITLSTAPAVDLEQWSLVVPGNAADAGAVFIVASTGTGTAQQIDAGYTGATSTAVTGNFYEDRLQLPDDVGKVIQVKRFGEAIPITPIGLERMSTLKMQDTSEGKPEFWSIYDYLTTGGPTTVRMLIVHPYPDVRYRLEIFYKQQLNTELSSTTQPFLPDEYRQLLVYGALARAYPIYLNDLERGKYFQAMFNDLLALMVAANREHASDHPHLEVENLYRHSRPRKAGGVNLGAWFDRLPFEP